MDQKWPDRQSRLPALGQVSRAVERLDRYYLIHAPLYILPPILTKYIPRYMPHIYVTYMSTTNNQSTCTWYLDTSIPPYISTYM